MAKTDKERQKASREHRAERGLTRREYWATEKTHEKLRKLLKKNEGEGDMKIKINRIQLNEDAGTYTGEDVEFFVDNKKLSEVLRDQPSKSSQEDGYEFMIWNDDYGTVGDSFRTSDPDPFEIGC